MVTRVKEDLAKRFTTSDLGKCTHFLGLKVDRKADGMFISQSAYAEKIVETAGMEESKPVSCPLPLSHPLYEDREEPSVEEKTFMRREPYRKILGSLLFLTTRNRPDIMAAVSMLAKFQSDPSVKHWKSLKTVVRYVYVTKEYGEFLPSDKKLKLSGWSDADWARDHENAGPVRVIS